MLVEMSSACKSISICYKHLKGCRRGHLTSLMMGQLMIDEAMCATTIYEGHRLVLEQSFTSHGVWGCHPY